MDNFLRRVYVASLRSNRDFKILMAFLSKFAVFFTSISWQEHWSYCIWGLVAVHANKECHLKHLSILWAYHSPKLPPEKHTEFWQSSHLNHIFQPELLYLRAPNWKQGTLGESSSKRPRKKQWVSQQEKCDQGWIRLVPFLDLKWQKSETVCMDLKELQSEHPSLQDHVICSKVLPKYLTNLSVSIVASTKLYTAALLPAQWFTYQALAHPLFLSTFQMTGQYKTFCFGQVALINTSRKSGRVVRICPPAK